jgi:hypothetical protein
MAAEKRIQIRHLNVRRIDDPLKIIPVVVGLISESDRERRVGKTNFRRKDSTRISMMQQIQSEFSKRASYC